MLYCRTVKNSLTMSFFLGMLLSGQSVLDARCWTESGGTRQEQQCDPAPAPTEDNPFPGPSCRWVTVALPDVQRCEPDDGDEYYKDYFEGEGVEPEDCTSEDPAVAETAHTNSDMCDQLALCPGDWR